MESPKTELQLVADASRELNERNDCAVRAITHASGVEYHKIHSMFKSNGRRTRGRTYSHISDRVMETLKMETKDITRAVRRYGKTIRTAQQYLTRGTYIVFTRGHMLCIKGGEVMDWADGRQHRIKQVLEVTNPGAFVEHDTLVARSAPVKPASAPREGSITAQVRALAQELWLSAGKPGEKAAIMLIRTEAATILLEKGFNHNTVKTQLSLWQKSITK